MPSKEKRGWSRLDNAAKIFPSTSEKTDTRVFRFSCELKEAVEPGCLQEALDRAVLEYPHFLCVMRRGFFWFYLEQWDLKPQVTRENKPPCSALYSKTQKTLLFEVSYFKNRINLELYHVLSDGTGALQFLKTIVFYYLSQRHKLNLASGVSPLDDMASVSEKTADSFQKYYEKEKGNNKVAVERAYRLKGAKKEDDRLRITEGMLSVRDVLSAAHQYHTTLTVYLTAVFIEAIHQEMTLREEKKYPLNLMVPVNLRNYFPSETAKNFFGMIKVPYHFGKSGGTFEDVVASVAQDFKRQLTKEDLSVRMNSMAALEHNPFIRAVPLPIKNIVLRIARHIGDMGETAVLSNIGRIDMPPELTPYIDSFHIFSSTLTLQLCLCSFEDRLQLGFSSAFVNTDIPKNFFRLLSEHGAQAEIRCNEFIVSK